MSHQSGKGSRKTLNAMKLRPFPITMDDRYAQDILQSLKSYFQHILTVTPKKHERPHPLIGAEELYRMAYTMVLHKRGEMLYSGFREVVVEHLTEKVYHDVLPSRNDDFLATLNTTWSSYDHSMESIKAILSYMDRVYVPQNGVHSVSTLGLILFRDLVVNRGSIRDRISQKLLSMVRRERKGEFVDRMAIKNTCEMLLVLGIESRSVYEDCFEKPFLDESAEFFKLESQLLLAENDASVYLQKVETRIQEEKERARQCLDRTTEEKIVKIVQKELTFYNLKTVIEMENSGVNHMLKHNKIEDLSRLFRLFKRVQGENNDVLMDWLKMVHDCVRRYFSEEVKEMENYEDPTTYLEEFEQVLTLIAEKIKLLKETRVRPGGEEY